MNYETTIDPVTGDFGTGEETPVRGRRWMVIAGVALALALVAVWFMTRGHGSEATGAASDKAAQAPTVTVITPGRTTIEGAITSTGTLAARREMPVGIAGEGGQVVQVLVDAGDWVRAGQVLAVIDRSVQVQQAASGVANISVAEADARLAQANLDRALKLVDKGFISKADVDRLTATRDAAVARVRVARASLGELNARTARLNIVAPASGLVLERRVEVGQVVGAGSGVLFSLARDGEMEMSAQVTESDLSGLSVGIPAQVTPAGTDRSFAGQVWQLSPVIDPQTRQGSARIALAYDPALRPGGFATARIRSGTVTAPLLPESAIQSDANGSYVYVVGPDNKVQRRPIKPGEVTEKGISVAEGLTGTERIVLRAGGFLAPGQLVNPEMTRTPAG